MAQAWSTSAFTAKCSSGYGRASEYRAVEPSDNQRMGKLADKQNTPKKKTHTQKVVNRCLQLWSEGSSRFRSRQLGLRHSSVLQGSRRADGSVQGILSQRMV